MGRVGYMVVFFQGAVFDMMQCIFNLPVILCSFQEVFWREVLRLAGSKQVPDFGLFLFFLCSRSGLSQDGSLLQTGIAKLFPEISDNVRLTEKQFPANGLSSFFSTLCASGFGRCFKRASNQRDSASFTSG